MSATILDTASAPRERPQQWAPPTADLDSTTDLHEENTTDLAPVTEDVTPAAEPGSSSASERPMPTPDTPKAQEPRPPSAISTDTPEPQSKARGVMPSTPVASGKPAREAKPAAESALAPGTVLCERYLLEQVVGCGGTAVIYRARDMLSANDAKPNAQVAIKIPRPEVTDRARAAARIRHEFEHAKRLSHPNIVRVLQLHEDGEQCFMAMELIEGRLLSDLVRDWTMLSPPLTHKILRACAQALAHAHGRDVVHGDFKPGNVFVTAGEDIKVVDFGAAASTPDDGAARIPAGTPAYASPEVLSGETPEPRDDVFSFACVAYELLTGQHPFERRSSLHARDEGMIPPRAWSLSAQQWLALLSALSWERDQRPANIDTLQAALTPESQTISETAPIHAPPGTAASTELAPDLMPRQSSSWGFFIFVACALAVIFIASQRRGEPTRGDATVSDATASTTVAALPPPARALAGDVARLADRNVTGHDPPPSSEPAAAALTKASVPAPAAASRTREVRARSGSAALSEISFESDSIVTTEGSVAAVFLIKRSQPLTNRARVKWRAVSGTADAGIDFASNAAGTVEFASGQAQRAIYVPLRNDLLKEGDETFTLQLESPQGGRVGSIATVEATIRDDD